MATYAAIPTPEGFTAYALREILRANDVTFRSLMKPDPDRHLSPFELQVRITSGGHSHKLTLGVTDYDNSKRRRDATAVHAYVRCAPSILDAGRKELQALLAVAAWRSFRDGEARWWHNDITAAMPRASPQSRPVLFRRCWRCWQRGNDPDANYCRYCGARVKQRWAMLPIPDPEPQPGRSRSRTPPLTAPPAAGTDDN